MPDKSFLLTERRKQIVNAIQFREEGVSYSDIGETLKIDRQIVQREIEFLFREGIIYPYAILNRAPLGEYSILILGRWPQGVDRNTFIRKLLARPEVDRVYQVYGKYTYALFGKVLNLHDLSNLMEDIGTQKVVLRSTRYIMGRSYLTNDSSLNSKKVIIGNDKAVEETSISPTEKKIIDYFDGFCGARPPTRRMINECAKLNFSTKNPGNSVSKYLNSLKEKGIFHGWNYKVDATRIGMYPSIVMLSLREKSSQLNKMVVDFISQNSNKIVAATKAIGAYDWLFLLEVNKREEIDKFTELVTQAIGGKCKTPVSLLVVDEHISKSERT